MANKKKKNKPLSTTIRRTMDVKPIHSEDEPLMFEVRIAEVKLMNSDALGDALWMEQGPSDERLQIGLSIPDANIVPSPTQDEEESAT